MTGDRWHVKHVLVSFLSKINSRFSLKWPRPIKSKGCHVCLLVWCFFVPFQGTWNGMDWRLLVKNLNGNLANLRTFYFKVWIIVWGLNIICAKSWDLHAHTKKLWIFTSFTVFSSCFTHIKWFLVKSLNFFLLQSLKIKVLIAKKKKLLLECPSPICRILLYQYLLYNLNHYNLGYFETLYWILSLFSQEQRRRGQQTIRWDKTGVLGGGWDWVKWAHVRGGILTMKQKKIIISLWVKKHIKLFLRTQFP